MPYKVNTKREGPGRYTLTYGRGSKKVTMSTQLLKADNIWALTDSYNTFPAVAKATTLREIRQAFELIAERRFACGRSDKGDESTPFKGMTTDAVTASAVSADAVSDATLATALLALTAEAAVELPMSTLRNELLDAYGWKDGDVLDREAAERMLRKEIARRGL